MLQNESSEILGKLRDMMDIEERLKYASWLNTVPGVGTKTIQKLLEYAQDEKNIYYLSQEELKRLLRKGQKEAFIQWKRQKSPEEEMEILMRKGICFYPHWHPMFPKRLADIPDAPYGVYCKGRLPDENRISIAIIGARSCSPYGRQMAEEFAVKLSAEKIQVISGLARGIDGAGQRAALDAGGDTFAVLGCGADVCYPKENWGLYERLCRLGGILSEYPPGTCPKAGYFPARNRLISGLSDAVLVIEARERSGTLITVDMALEQGKEVFALPGRATDLLSAGCNRLIRQGACIAASPEDVLEEMGLLCGRRETKEKAERVFETSLQQKVYEATDQMPKHINKIAEEIGENVVWQELLTCIVEMTIEGSLREAGNSYYSRAE